MERDLYSEINKRIHELTVAQSDPVEYRCECGAVTCATMIPLRRSAYEAIIRSSDCLLVVRGHDGPGTEVVGYARDYLIVRKSNARRLRAVS